jgi:hypothetical protein
LYQKQGLRFSISALIIGDSASWLFKFEKQMRMIAQDLKAYSRFEFMRNVREREAYK